MINSPDYIDIDPKADEERLIKKYETETNTVLYPGQDTRIMIALMVYYANLIKTQFNEAAKLNLVRFSRSPILDFLGEYKNCKRLDNEEDKDYIDRILLAPEGFSVAGPELAYIYFAKSADSSIKDVSVACPCDNITVGLDEERREILQPEVSTEALNIETDFKNSSVKLTLNQALEAGQAIEVTIPNPYRLIIYVLAETVPTAEVVINKVYEILDPVKPLCDSIEVRSAQVEEFEISGRIKLYKNADEDSVKTQVNSILNEYLEQFKNILKKSVVPGQIYSKICSIKGVYDFEMENPAEILSAQPNISYCGLIGEITYEKVAENE